jgi:hypothetical protein
MMMEEGIMGRTLISSQRYLDDETVARKLAAEDYVVEYVVLEHDGQTLWHVIDGHHSYAAAIEAGVEPEYRHNATVQQEADSMDLDSYLEAHFIDSEWYDLETGRAIF